MAKTKEQKLYRPSDLAKELEVDAKQIRGYLRKQFARSPEAKNTSWMLTEDQAKAVREHFSPKESEEA